MAFRVPVTGDMVYDFTLVVIVIILGFFLALKAEKSWGYILVVLALCWAVLLVKRITG